MMSPPAVSQPSFTDTGRLPSSASTTACRAFNSARWFAGSRAQRLARRKAAHDEGAWVREAAAAYAAKHSTGRADTTGETGHETEAERA